ncbi:hypothetical protein LTR09_009405 [Extremus antarcticus]|uniref:Uncharacterized protein n=1 Tax=Extremus antarcticus TaxID=702011 RepID=A0AAJ0DFD3_9PEZI|nr:hypothetical protein LTR09_009405 [Extremus antarcticus]
MRRQTPIAHLLHTHLYPSPLPTDPPTFSAHLARNLVPEVRIEVATFYGDLNSTEARYPGLNYCHAPHRMRLGRFKHHRRLFEAFDSLGLTEGEIQEFCCWEGTKWARERYEKDEGIVVKDTTGDEIGPYVDRRSVREEDGKRRSIVRKTDISVVVERARTQIQQAQQQIEEESEEDEPMSDADEVEEPEQPNEVEEGADGEETPTEAAARREHISHLRHRRDRSILNEHIRAALHSGQRLPPHIEDYLKEERERGSSMVDPEFLRWLATRTRIGSANGGGSVTGARGATRTTRAAA